MSTIDPADWQARAAHIRQSIPADQLSDTALALVLNSFLLADDEGRVWAFNGFSWAAWDGQQWQQAAPTGILELQAFAPAAETEAEASPVAAATEPAEAPMTVVESMEEPAAAPMAAAPMAAEPMTAEPADESITFAEATAADEPEPLPASVSFAEMTAEPEAMAVEAPEPVAEPEPAEVPVPTAAVGAAPAMEPVSAPGSMSSPEPMPAAPSAAVGHSAPSMAPAEPVQWPAPQAAPAFQYRPSHAVPAPGMAAWSRPDPSIAPEFRLWPGLDVMVVEWLPSGWARVVTSNQWSGWVDGRMLQPYR